MDRNTDARLLEEFISPSEVILWTGRPGRLSYVMGGFSGLLFGLFWGMFDLFFLVAAYLSDSLSIPVVLFLAIHAIPFYLGVWNFVVRNVEYKEVIYAYTDKRVIIREGFMGIDYRTVDYARMFNARVKVNPIERMKGQGTIILSTGDRVVSSRGTQTRQEEFVGIDEPYQVFRELQMVSSEITHAADDDGMKMDFMDYYSDKY